MGLKQVFDNLTVKHMDALRKQIQSYAMLGNFQNDRKKYFTLEVLFGLL